MSEQHALLNYLVQKNAKKQHLYIKNNNSGPTIRLSPHVTNLHHSNLFAFIGAIAEELICLSRRL